MRARFSLLGVIALAIFSGCTPFGEGMLRKFEVSDDRTALPDRSGNMEMESVAHMYSLDFSTRTTIRSYGPVIKAYSKRYGFDWRLILAVIRQESRFSPNAVSHKGAYGLMQIMPVTGKEVSRVLGIKNITLPKNNIHGGIFYLRTLYNRFEAAEEAERLKLSLAAYNAGLGRVFDAQGIAAYFNESPYEWQAIRDAMPLLSKRYYTLHRNVWDQNRPRSGWFGDSEETIAYVESVMEYYDEYRLLLN
ncbi:MAG: transglycosylase SLT domain-containing protein [Bacteroidetes bacterium]|nr:transglycosylase SLT domain-containing protein [Bacteroidota bacterium]